MRKPHEKLSIAFLFDDTLDSNDGVAQYVKALGAWLSSQGHEVSYLAGQTKLRSWAGGRVYSLARNFPVSFNSNRLSVPLPASGRRIDKLLAARHLDILHVQVPHSPLMSQKVINRSSPDTAVIGTFHILPASRLAIFGSRALRLAYFTGLRRFDTVLSVSLPAARFAKQFFGLDSEVVPNVVDLKRFVPSSAQKQVPQTDILFLGRLVPRKGCQELLEAFRLLHKRHPRVKLTVAGDGPERSELEKFVAKNNLGGSVSFMGYIEESDKAGLLAGAKIACFPSLHGESFGIVLLEAMAAGSGVVLGGNNPGYRSVLAEQPELLVDPSDSAAFARRLELLLKDPDLRNRLHAWQMRHVRQYDVGKVGPKVLQAYRLAIAKRREMRDN